MSERLLARPSDPSTPDRVHSVTILGAGSAGLLAALALKRRLPFLEVRIIRSPEIGVIGVGEGTTPNFPAFLFDYLRFDPGLFYREAQPTWKLGIQFLWGPRERFHYSFSPMLDGRWPDLPKAHGFYCHANAENVDLWSALMAQDKALPRGADNVPNLQRHQCLAFHIENKKLVEYLERRCLECGVEIVDGTVHEVERHGERIVSLRLEDGRTCGADLFVDASGFRSELLGRSYDEPLLSYENSLFCDRAVIGGWPRTDEPIHPYTTAETMDAGWAWQIEHEHFINRGYVYSSRFISDDDARAEFLRKNPRVATEPRMVKYTTGRRRRFWIGNTVGIGNASGFVEPLEATALMVIVVQCTSLAECLAESDCTPTPGIRGIYNEVVSQGWDLVRDFLAVHYRFNTRLETDFWRTARAEVDLGGAGGIVDFYRENGPTGIGKSLLIHRNDPFGYPGYLAMLVGQAVPYARQGHDLKGEQQIFEKHRQELVNIARSGFTVAEGLQWVRMRNWRWN